MGAIKDFFFPSDLPTGTVESDWEVVNFIPQPDITARELAAVLSLYMANLHLYFPREGSHEKVFSASFDLEQARLARRHLEPA